MYKFFQMVHIVIGAAQMDVLKDKHNVSNFLQESQEYLMNPVKIVVASNPYIYGLLWP